MKALLIGMLLASPPVAAWILRAPAQSMEIADIQLVPEKSTSSEIRIPVEVVAKGSPNQWVYVQIPRQTIPEPGITSWLALASLLLFRRQRPGGK